MNLLSERGTMGRKNPPTSVTFYPEVQDHVRSLTGLYGSKTNVVNAALLMFASAPRTEKDRFMAVVGNLKAGLPLPAVEEESLEQAIHRLQAALKAKRR